MCTLLCTKLSGGWRNHLLTKSVQNANLSQLNIKLDRSPMPPVCCVALCSPHVLKKIKAAPQISTAIHTRQPRLQNQYLRDVQSPPSVTPTSPRLLDLKPLHSNLCCTLNKSMLNLCAIHYVQVQMERHVSPLPYSERKVYHASKPHVLSVNGGFFLR